MVHTPRPGRTGRLLGAAGLLALAGAAGLGNDARATASGAAADSAAVPRLEDSECAPTVAVSDRVRCLTLVVPESREAGANPDRLVRLPVAIIAATDPSERFDDPLVWMDYSAGYGFIGSRVRFFTEEALAINEHRDVITLDLRGTGYATPSLGCPELTELNGGAFAAEIDETTAEGRAMRLDAIAQCHDRLVADGVDLSAYGADDAAQDLDDLRVALGVEQWNLVVGDHGSKLAQILARDHSASVRSVVVASTPIPLQADFFAGLAGNAAGGWGAIVAACADDAGCAAAFPDLGDRFEALIADLTANPRHYDDPGVPLAGGETRPWLETASRMLEFIRANGRVGEYAMMLPNHVAGPPGVPAELFRTMDLDDPTTLLDHASDAYYWSEPGLWEPYPQLTDTSMGTYSFGAHLSAVCRDEAPFTDPAALEAAAEVPLFGPFLGLHADLEACEVWDVGAAPAAANEAVHSDVPFLVLAGEFDTVSSPAWAEAFADGLTAAQIVHFPGVGTQPTGGGATTTLTCAREIRDEFLAAPTEPIDDSCVDTAHGLPFLVP
jgi:pimeloyl-ACP methyl ester carboxylesterase